MTFHVATSELTNRIYAGTVAKNGYCWNKKNDVTGEACAAVAQHVLANDAPVIVTANGKPAYKISVEKL